VAVGDDGGVCQFLTVPVPADVEDVITATPTSEPAGLIWGRMLAALPERVATAAALAGPAANRNKPQAPGSVVVEESPAPRTGAHSIEQAHLPTGRYAMGDSNGTETGVEGQRNSG
jgi:hypothetical protein